MPLPTTVEPLAAHRDALVELSAWLTEQWPDWYGPSGRGKAHEDLLACARGGVELPFGVVALRGDEVCGIAALRSKSIPSHRHLTPWATTLLVKPSMRKSGVGSSLIAALEHEARVRGFADIHCATASAESLLLRRSWRSRERIAVDGRLLGIYHKTL